MTTYLLNFLTLTAWFAKILLLPGMVPDSYIRGGKIMAQIATECFVVWVIFMPVKKDVPA